MTTAPLSLYFSPLACSFASRAVVYETGAHVSLVEVDGARRLPDGRDYRAIHPLGLVPALVLDDGEVLTENAAVLQYLGGALVPAETRERARLHSWLSYIGTELHKATFVPLLLPDAPPEAKAYALAGAGPRLDWLATRLRDRSTLLESGLSVADAYLVAVLNWTVATPVVLAGWPSLRTYHANLLQRPAFARALNEERSLWAARNPERAKLIERTP